MKHLNYFLAFLLLIITSACHTSKKDKAVQEEIKQPNIILILADDMGFGDTKRYNHSSKIPTPNIDELAREGMRFTDAHTNSSVCTPTRYGIITGQYAWRSSLKKGVTWSYDSLIIPKKTKTIATVLKSKGYHTAAVGKWHLGLGWQKEQDSVLFDKPLTAGPTDLGFDYYYGIAASLDIPPYVYIENKKVTQVPNGYSEGNSKTYGGAFWRKGLVAPNFDHYNVLNHLTVTAEAKIKALSKEKAPFFMYFALTAPHTPWIPKDEYKGKSEAGDYGDLMVEVDDVVGRINNLLKSLDIDDNTIVIFTSDNGSALSSDLIAKYQHDTNGPWRGRKGDIYEGGHRVPFIVKWPEKIIQNTQSNQLVSTTDFYATFADIVNENTIQGTGSNRKDSQSFLPALLQEKVPRNMRQSMVYHSVVGMFGLRDKDYVYINGKGSGGFLEVPDTTHIKVPKQIYNLTQDATESENLFVSHAKLAERFQIKLDSIIN
ncbi:sulfatase family protein [Tamlana sp. I1]|uniref:sulfatase family protein n=1 Tax=Tamlana sp. I1 TaxID=2762061 RepID=UPI0018906CEF|nr:arylsulfatase [Tamlana sp. I1]